VSRPTCSEEELSRSSSGCKRGYEKALHLAKKNENKIHPEYHCQKKDCTTKGRFSTSSGEQTFQVSVNGPRKRLAGYPLGTGKKEEISHNNTEEREGPSLRCYYFSQKERVILTEKGKGTLTSRELGISSIVNSMIGGGKASASTVIFERREGFLVRRSTDDIYRLSADSEKGR